MLIAAEPNIIPKMISANTSFMIFLVLLLKRYYNQNFVFALGVITDFCRFFLQVEWRHHIQGNKYTWVKCLYSLI